MESAPTLAEPDTAAPDRAASAPVADAVVAENVVKSFTAGNRTVEILHGISLKVRAGEMCAVMGPSGSGKSTLLYCLAGLDPATSGDVRILGRSVAQSTPTDLAKLRRSDVGFVFQQYNLVPTLTAFENAALPFRLRGDRPPAEEILANLDKLGLAKLAQARPTSMSGGEQQRVALARVLSQRPKVIFADEPTGALDTRTGQIVLQELREIAHNPDQCVLTVTHDPTVAAACDRVIYLRDGNLVEEQTRPTVVDVTDTLTRLAEGIR